MEEIDTWAKSHTFVWKIYKKELVAKVLVKIIDRLIVALVSQ